eukprot:NODE_4971_length_435_cov_104.844560_g4307_i0.p1 GENE.NODE_4971_length_435_cov_104.844560_g4307_i0~~NODE_4971_length_435_cov_104.844560_g4307_i0.p1  ORF type:complete len:58 (+),score=6.35 NODE_4971_length_435_cov_104.844560_g4307_i0:246-419(+)
MANAGLPTLQKGLVFGYLEPIPWHSPVSPAVHPDQWKLCTSQNLGPQTQSCPPCTLR